MQVVPAEADVPAPDDQGAVIGFLSRPESYGLSDEMVERVETHCSIVFLAARHAVKLKRAIRYGMLDYTTLARRKAACRAEFLLNRRTAPDLYRGVRAITLAADGALAFDGAGMPIDHVVVMRRFAQRDLFDQMADTGRLDAELMRALGHAVARFHAAAEPTPAFGGDAGISRVIAETADELRAVAELLGEAPIDALAGQAWAALAAVAPLLEARRRAGKVRACHGDLRLANICLFEGRPTLFDGIEFSDEIRCIDVLYDLAFLLMDLDLRGRADLAGIVLDGYLADMPEAEGLPALPLFLALRAAMRSYALAGSALRQPDPHEQSERIAAARHCLAASAAYLAPDTPHFIG